MAINRCLCHNRSFEEIKTYAHKYDIHTIEELQSRKICSCGCRICLPYVEKMLKTGETSFEPGTAYS